MSDILKVLVNCPKHWVSHTLGDLCKVVGGSTPDTGVAAYWGGDVTWVTPYDLGRLDGPYINGSSRTISQYGLRNCSAEITPMGSVVLSSRAPIGYVGVAGIPLATNQGCKSFIPGPSIDTFYLYYLLLFMKPLLQELGSGATFAEVSKSTLSGLLVPLPPLSEQKRIVAILNEQMVAVEKARAAAEAQLEAAKALPAAYLREVFQGINPITVESQPRQCIARWKWHRLDEVAKLESGHTPSRYHPEWWGGDIPWLALPDIRALDGHYAYETIECTNEMGIENSSARVLPQGTVCLSRTASVGFVTILGRPMATSQDFVNWVCGEELLPEQLMISLIASREYIHSLASGAIHKTVYMPTAEALSVMIPPTEQQLSITSSLFERLEGCRLLQRKVEELNQEIEALPAALLRRAFSGAL